MIAITGATGHLGRLVVADLIDRGNAPSEIVAAVRSPEKAAALADRGVTVRKADYDQPETLRSAFEGVERLLLISSSEVGERARTIAAIVAQSTAGATLAPPNFRRTTELISSNYF